jgi:hypothetical protein
LPPFHNHVRQFFGVLSPQGWAEGELAGEMLGIARTADPVEQSKLEFRVERLARDGSYGAIVDAWDGEIEPFGMVTQL